MAEGVLILYFSIFKAVNSLKIIFIYILEALVRQRTGLNFHFISNTLVQHVTCVIKEKGISICVRNGT